LLLDRVKGLVIVNVDLGVKVVVGDSGDGCSCVRSSGGLGRHVWGGRNKGGFPKDKTDKSCFYMQGKKEKKRKSKIKFLFYYLLFFIWMFSS
jgi:hypothetical protein